MYAKNVKFQPFLLFHFHARCVINFLMFEKCVCFAFYWPKSYTVTYSSLYSCWYRCWSVDNRCHSQYIRLTLYLCVSPIFAVLIKDSYVCDECVYIGLWVYSFSYSHTIILNVRLNGKRRKRFMHLIAYKYSSVALACVVCMYRDSHFSKYKSTGQIFNVHLMVRHYIDHNAMIPKHTRTKKPFR